MAFQIKKINAVYFVKGKYNPCHAQEITLFFKQIIQSGERVLIRMDELLDTDGSFIQELKRLKRNLSNPDTLRWYKRER